MQTMQSVSKITETFWSHKDGLTVINLIQISYTGCRGIEKSIVTSRYASAVVGLPLDPKVESAKLCNKP